MSIERPLDLLNELKGIQVKVTLRDSKTIYGILRAFDIHINLVIDIDGKNKFIRGDNVIDIEESSSTSPARSSSKSERRS